MNNEPKDCKELFIGNLKKRDRENKDVFFTGIIYLENIDNLPAEHIKEDKNNKQFIKVAVLPKRNPDTNGNTHNIKIDLYQPQKKWNLFSTYTSGLIKIRIIILNTPL